MIATSSEQYGTIRQNVGTIKAVPKAPPKQEEEDMGEEVDIGACNTILVEREDF